MGPADRLRSLLGRLVRLAAVLVLLGVVVAVVWWGGPLGPTDPARGPADLEDGSTVTETDPRRGATTERPSAGSAGPGPWGRRVLVVAVSNDAAPTRDVTSAVADALAFWNENRAYGDYAAEFRLDPAADPDIVVEYRSSVDCPAARGSIGCAPLIESDSRIERPVVVKIEYDPTDNRRQVRNTVIHELGHVLGIAHCEPPDWVMASGCAGQLAPVPAATERDLAWRDDTLAVFVDDANVSAVERPGTREQVEHALAYFERTDRGTPPAPVTFVRVDDRFSADVTISFVEGSTCGGGAVVCYERRGRDVDGDGRLDYHTAGTVVVALETDVDARGWYVGWAMANQLAPGELPAAFEDASYRERRSRWWE